MSLCPPPSPFVVVSSSRRLRVWSVTWLKPRAGVLCRQAPRSRFGPPPASAALTASRNFRNTKPAPRPDYLVTSTTGEFSLTYNIPLRLFRKQSITLPGTEPHSRERHHSSARSHLHPTPRSERLLTAPPRPTCALPSRPLASWASLASLLLPTAALRLAGTSPRPSSRLPLGTTGDGTELAHSNDTAHLKAPRPSPILCSETTAVTMGSSFSSRGSGNPTTLDSSSLMARETWSGQQRSGLRQTTSRCKLSMVAGT